MVRQIGLEFAIISSRVAQETIEHMIINQVWKPEFRLVRNKGLS